MTTKGLKIKSHQVALFALTMLQSASFWHCLDIEGLEKEKK